MLTTEVNTLTAHAEWVTLSKDPQLFAFFKQTLAYVVHAHARGVSP